MMNEKDKIINAIYAEYPSLQYDNLKKYYIEQLVDTYIDNPKQFKDFTYKAKNEHYEHKPLPTEIFCISKIDEDNNN